MTACNARLTTLTVTSEVISTWHDDAGWQPPVKDIPDGAVVKRDGGLLLRCEVTVVTCERNPQSKACRTGKWHRQGRVLWNDDTPGATPHVSEPDPYEPTEAQLSAAMQAMDDVGWGEGEDVDSALLWPDSDRMKLAVVLRAAAKATSTSAAAVRPDTTVRCCSHRR